MDCDLAYLAGFLDGDGAVMLRPVTGHASSYLLTVAVTSCSEAQCVAFEQAFGGSVMRCDYSKRLNRDGRATVSFQWRATQKKAEAALLLLRPYLRVRQEHAELGLAYRARVGKRGQEVTAREAIARAGIAGRVRDLNARGAHVSLVRLGAGPGLSAEEEMAYLAGLFDAEGTVTWVRDRGRIAPLLHVGVQAVVDSIPLRFALRFGGNVTEIKRAGRGIFGWYRRQAKAIPVLQALLPYLREKRHAAEVALDTGIRPAARVLPFRQEG